MSPDSGLRVSVITTVKNESSAIRALLSSLFDQTRQPDEVVIVDGGSSDDTVQQIRQFSQERQFPIRLIIRPGANISQGRNAAIEAATHDIIASTDAGVRLCPIWLEELLRPFTERKNVHVISGFFLPEPGAHSIFETAMGATVLPILDNIDPSSFLPSSRSIAYTKETWQKVGGYPEWLDYCEDLILDFKFKNLGYEFAFAPKAIAYFRPRTSLQAFFRQYYRYARGDGKADLWIKRHAARYFTYLMAPILLVVGFWFHLLWLPLFVGVIIYTWTPYRRLLPMIEGYTVWQKVEAAAWVPVIRFVGDAAKMIGYPVGVFWRLRNRSQKGWD